MKGFTLSIERSRLRVVWMAKRPKSQAIQRLPSFSATAAVVPLPQKQSRTRSPSLDEALIMRSKRASGFWVGSLTLSSACEFIALISVQIEWIAVPSVSSKYLFTRGIPASLKMILPAAQSMSMFSCFHLHIAPEGGAITRLPNLIGLPALPCAGAVGLSNVYLRPFSSLNV